MQNIYNTYIDSMRIQKKFCMRNKQIQVGKIAEIKLYQASFFLHKHMHDVHKSENDLSVWREQQSVK